MSKERGEPQSLAPGELPALLLRRRRVLVFAGVVGLVLGLSFGLLRRPRFHASATIQLAPSASSGLLGNLSMLVPMAGGGGAAAEIALLRSRTVAEATVLPPADLAPVTPDDEAYLQRPGLTTRVVDRGLTTGSLVLARFRETDTTRPPVQPEARLFAHLERPTVDAPRRVKVTFLDEERVRVETHGLTTRLGIADAAPEEHRLVPGQPIEYRGATLRLAPRGPVAGRTFVLAHVPPYEAVEGLLNSSWATETKLNSGVVRVTVEDTDPFRAAEIANALCRNYLDEARTRDSGRSGRTTDFIEDLLEDSFSALHAAQAELLRLRAEKPETLDVEAVFGAVLDQVSAAEVQRTALRLRREALTDVAATLEEGDPSALARLDSAVTAGLVVDPVTEGYLEQLARLNGRYVELVQRYTEGHPDLVSIQGAADDLVGLIATQLDNRLQGLHAQEADLDATIDEMTAGLADLPAELAEVTPHVLEIQIQQALIPELLRNLKATEIADASTGFRAELLDPAEPATEVASPDLKALGAVGAALGLVLGALVVVVRDPVSGAVAGADALHEVTGVELLAELPAAKDASGDEAIRSLRAALQRLRAAPGERPLRVVGIAGVGSHDDGATTTGRLARSCAHGGERVALVDANLRRPHQAGGFGVEEVPGLAETLARGDESAPLRATGIEGLELLPAGAGAQDGVSPGDLLHRRGVAPLLRGLGEDRDLVLVDLPAAGDDADLESVAPKVDGILLVCRRGGVRRSELRGAVRSIARAGGHLVGTILTEPR